jgi:hypothetical protein
MSICTAAEIKDMVLSFCMPITNPTVTKALMHLCLIYLCCTSQPLSFRFLPSAQPFPGFFEIFAVTQSDRSSCSSIIYDKYGNTHFRLIGGHAPSSLLYWLCRNWRNRGHLAKRNLPCTCRGRCSADVHVVVTFQPHPVNRILPDVPNYAKLMQNQNADEELYSALWV